MIRLDIISDIACPWCYVGKAFLDRALESVADHPFRIEWHPFQLNPDLPREGMDRAEYMALKFGSPDQVVRVHEPLLRHAEAAGADFDLAAITRTPNTLDAHRLIHWAGLEGRQTPMVSALFRAYWREGRDIGDAAVLTDLAGSVGLDRTVVERLLASDADMAEIQTRDRNARARGVQGVPTFVIADRYAVSGAQPADSWAKIIAEVIEKADEL